MQVAQLVETDRAITAQLRRPDSALATAAPQTISPDESMTSLQRERVLPTMIANNQDTSRYWPPTCSSAATDETRFRSSASPRTQPPAALRLPPELRKRLPTNGMACASGNSQRPRAFDGCCWPSTAATYLIDSQQRHWQRMLSTTASSNGKAQPAPPGST